jgi:hypothetical protein
MPSKTSKKKPAAALPTIPKELLGQFVSGPTRAEFNRKTSEPRQARRETNALCALVPPDR